MQRKPHRIDQVNSLIKQYFGEILAQEIDTPAGTLITVTKVHTSKDLRYAKVGLSIYPGEAAGKIFAGICRNLKQLKHLLHKKITLKYAPELRLYLDTTAQKAEAMERLLNQVKQRSVFLKTSE